MTNHLEPFSNIESSVLSSPSEANNDLFLSGYNSLLSNHNTIVARDIYLLLVVYVNCFCVPTLSFVLKGLSGFVEGVQTKISVTSKFVYLPVTLFVVNKGSICMLLFLRKKQVGFNPLSRNTYCKTVLL